jgi:DNA (cytosine-5)-methyltransferase 1
MDTLIKHKAKHQAKGNGFGYEIRDLNGIAGTIVCGGMGKERNLIVDERPHSLVPMTKIKGKINEDLPDGNRRRVFSLRAVSDKYLDKP